MKKIKLDIIGLSYSQTQSGAYALVLGEFGGRTRLPIIIGGFEAQAIAIEIEGMTPSRPLTHDLFKSMATSFNIELKEVLIYNLVDGIFFAKLICTSKDTTIEIDARTSDAIALAVRFKCPIYTYEFILTTAGITIEADDLVFLENLTSKKEDPEEKKGPNSYSSFTENELQEKLKNALEEEAYEKAAKIRDEIIKRKSS